MLCEDVRFRSGDAECAGWLYRPDGAEEALACVVLAHGFAGVKEARLDAFGIYLGEPFERAIADQLGFLERNL